MPRGHEHDSIYIYSLLIYPRFSGQSSLSFPRKRLEWEKKDRCTVFGCNNDRFFLEKDTVNFFFCPKSARKY